MIRDTTKNPFQLMKPAELKEEYLKLINDDKPELLEFLKEELSRRKYSVEIRYYPFAVFTKVRQGVGDPTVTRYELSEDCKPVQIGSRLL